MKGTIGWLTRMSVLGLLVGLGCVGRADADQTLVLNDFNHENINFTFQGNSYNVNGGNIVPSTLDGRSLSYVYCVQFTIEVGVPGTYTHTLVNSSGNVGAGQTLLTNAGEVAWLLTNIAPTVGTDLDKQAGLQAAIWYEVSGGSANNGFVFGSNTQGITNAFNTYIAQLGANANGSGAAVHTAPVSNVLYMTPGDGSRSFQALVTLATPEPSTSVMAATGFLVIVGSLWRRHRAKAE